MAKNNNSYNTDKMIAKAAYEGLKKRNLIQVKKSMILKPEKPLVTWLKEADELYKKEARKQA